MFSWVWFDVILTMTLVWENKLDEEDCKRLYSDTMNRKFEKSDPTVTIYTLSQLPGVAFDVAADISEHKEGADERHHHFIITVMIWPICRYDHSILVVMIDS